jgi:glycosyltransferase involved in cell wall biosynthesis
MGFRGGGEEYALELAKTLDAPLYTSRCEIDTDQVDVCEFGSKSLTGRLLRGSPLRTWAEMLEYENFTVPDEHDIVITSGNVAKALIHRPFQRRIHLLHTPPRWLFDISSGQFGAGPLGTLKRAYQSALRVQDVSTVPRIDDFVVNSEVIARRLRTYYHRESEASIYPPIDVDEYHSAPSDGYLLSLGRLEPHKHVAEIIEAVRNTTHELKIAGTGSEESRLKQKSGDNVEFLGYVPEERKYELLANCEAFVANSYHEDFGITPIEALASGKPVIGVNEGFTRFQIEDGINGILFERGNLTEVINEATNREWDFERIRTTAQKFDIDVFRRKWRTLIYSEKPD